QPPHHQAPLLLSHTVAGLLPRKAANLARTPMAGTFTQERCLLLRCVGVTVKRKVVADHGGAQSQRCQPLFVVLGLVSKVVRMDTPDFQSVKLLRARPLG